SSEFDGQSPVQTWHLYLTDQYSTDQGEYDYWELTINYSYVVDDQGPYAPGSVDITSNSTYDTGYSQTDNLTKERNPQFEWSKPSDRGASGTKNYYYWFIENSSGSNVDDGTTTSTSVRPGNQSAGTYGFYVRAQDNEGNWGDWGYTSFIIDTSGPSSPTPYSPSGEISSISPTIYWTYSSSTDWKYDVNLEYKYLGVYWNVSGWPKPAIRTGSIDTSGLSWETEYAVRVQEYDIAGNPGGYGSWRYFTTHDNA
ncbi:unnamed protein product, partial [marine sediment metagenome]